MKWGETTVGYKLEKSLGKTGAGKLELLSQPFFGYAFNIKLVSFVDVGVIAGTF
jgi:hypothetical protein